MRRNNKLIIVISIIVILAIVGTIFAYLFIKTDLFKSNEVLFAKYILQNTEKIEKLTDFQTIEVYESLVNQNKYEANTNAKMTYSEGGEISNPLNNLTAKLNIQRDNEEKYVYADGQILYEDEEYLRTEIIREQDTYGIRFTDAVKQFVTVNKDENTEEVAKDIGIGDVQLEKIINTIQGSEQLLTNEQIKTLKSKYLNILVEELLNGTFGKQRSAMITYNDATTKTNAYWISLNSEQVTNLLLKMLNNIKNETEILDKLQIFMSKEDTLKFIDETINKVNEELEIPTIKVIVYEQNQKTIRTDIEVGLYKISIDNVEENGQNVTKISYSDFNNEHVLQYNFKISKVNTENSEKLEIIMNVIEGEENYTNTILGEMQILDNKIKLDVDISHKQNITTISLKIENEINIGKNFEKTETLVLGNNMLISSVEQQKRKVIIDVLKKIVPETTNKRRELLEQKLGIKEGNVEIENNNEENIQSENQLSQVEINKFNSKFEFYTGDEVSAENVKMLLDIAKNNVSGHVIGTVTNQNDENVQDRSNITLYIEKDKTNEESITKAVEEVKDNKKYKVLIFYKEANGLIDYITITEI